MGRKAQKAARLGLLAVRLWWCSASSPPPLAFSCTSVTAAVTVVPCGQDSIDNLCL